MPDWIWFFVIIFGLPATIAGATDIFKRWAKLKEKQMELAAHLAADKAAAQATHIERLEARMRVLERIATDKSALVAEEIELLRDGRAH